QQQGIEEHRQQLKQRIEMMNLVEKEIEGDGNCQFGALSHQLFNDTNRSREVRHKIVSWLQHNDKWKNEFGDDDNDDDGQQSELSNFVEGTWQSYCDRMCSEGEWGD